jgi:uncharacterized protein YllA (UPF0747 family)
MTPRIVSTPIAGAGVPAKVTPRRVSAEVLAAVMPGPGRDRLASGEVLAVTTGQQPGLFTGPLYTIYKALSAVALARCLEREVNVPVVPVFWVAGDDHDFAEANHASVLNAAGDVVRIVLRERAPDGMLLPLFREPCGPEIGKALEQLRAALPETEFTAQTLAWLEASYRPETNLADAGADALNRLLGRRGIAVFRAHDPAAKRAAAPWLLKGLDLTLPDGLSPVLVEGSAGRDRLSGGGESAMTRRSGERFTRAALERIAAESPERLSPNVLLRPVIEAALFPTAAYAAGPAELEYLATAAPLYAQLGVTRQTPVPRWSGILLEAKVEKVLERYKLTPADFAGPPGGGALEARFARDAVPAEISDSLVRLRADLDQYYGRLATAIARIDPTLERNVQSARNAALAGTQEVEKKLVASLKRANETLSGQLGRARASLFPEGQPQERVLTAASFVGRYGPELVDAIEAEVARWAGLP